MKAKDIPVGVPMRASRGAGYGYDHDLVIALDNRTWYQVYEPGSPRWDYLSRRRVEERFYWTSTKPVRDFDIRAFGVPVVKTAGRRAVRRGVPAAEEWKFTLLPPANVRGTWADHVAHEAAAAAAAAADTAKRKVDTARAEALRPRLAALLLPGQAIPFIGTGGASMGLDALERLVGLAEDGAAFRAKEAAETAAIVAMAPDLLG